MVLGLGLATLRPSDGNSDTLMRLTDTTDICIGGVLFDAGKHTETLLEAGSENGHEGNPATYTVLSDLFFRVGGAKEVNTSVEVCVKINGNNVVETTSGYGAPTTGTESVGIKTQPTRVL